MAYFIDVARVSQVAPGTARLVTVVDNGVALFNVSGRIFAVDDSCVRCGASLAAGKLHGAVVRCSGCDWQYDVRTGAVNGIPALRADTFEVRIVESRVMIATAGGSAP